MRSGMFWSQAPSESQVAGARIGQRSIQIISKGKAKEGRGLTSAVLLILLRKLGKLVKIWESK